MVGADDGYQAVYMVYDAGNSHPSGVGVDKNAGKGDCHEAPGSRDTFCLGVAQVAAMVRNGAGVGVRGDDGPLRYREQFVQRLVAQVRRVHDHAQLFHFSYDRKPEGREPVGAGMFGAAADGVDAIPGQGHEADSARVEAAQLVEALAYRLAALDGQEGRERAILLGSQHRRPGGEPSAAAATVYRRFHDRQQLERVLPGRLDEHRIGKKREKLGGDSALPQARKINMPGIVAGAEVEGLYGLAFKIVAGSGYGGVAVPVYDDETIVQFPGRQVHVRVPSRRDLRRSRAAPRGGAGRHWSTPSRDALGGYSC